MKNTLRIAIAALLVTFAGTARAQQPGTHADPATQTYAAFRLAVAMPQHDDLDGLDNGFGFEAAFGRMINPNLAVEGSIGRFGFGDSATYSEYGYTVKEEFNVAAIPLMATVKGIIPAGQASLYGLAGVGLYFTSYEDKVSSGGQSAKISDDSTAFGLHLGGGVQFALSPRLNLGAEVKYVIASTEFDVEGSDVDVGLNSILLGAMIGYSF